MTTEQTTTARRPDGAALFIALVLAVIAAIVAWQTMQMRVMPIQAKVGPTVFPYIIAAALAILAVCTAVSAFRGAFPARTKDNYGPVLWIVAGLIAQMLLLSTLGFAIATSLLFAFTAKGFGRGPLWKTIPIGFVFAFIVWLIFSHGLQLSLPKGPLERLIP